MPFQQGTTQHCQEASTWRNALIAFALAAAAGLLLVACERPSGRTQDAAEGAVTGADEAIAFANAYTRLQEFGPDEIVVKSAEARDLERGANRPPTTLAAMSGREVWRVTYTGIEWESPQASASGITAFDVYLSEYGRLLGITSHWQEGVDPKYDRSVELAHAKATRRHPTPPPLVPHDPTVVDPSPLSSIPQIPASEPLEQGLAADPSIKFIELYYSTTVRLDLSASEPPPDGTWTVWSHGGIPPRSSGGDTPGHGKSPTVRLPDPGARSPWPDPEVVRSSRLSFSNARTGESLGAILEAGRYDDPLGQ